MPTTPSSLAFISSGSTNAARAPTTPSATAPQPLLRAAFYGRSNSPYLGRAGQIIARQFQICRSACSGRAELVRYFYDIPQAIDRTELQRIPPFLNGPPEYHGGWQELAALIPARERGFDVVVCLSLDRISRRIGELKERGDVLTRLRAPLISVEDGWQEATPTLWDLASGDASLPDSGLTGRRRHASALRRRPRGRK